MPLLRVPCHFTGFARLVWGGSKCSFNLIRIDFVFSNCIISYILLPLLLLCIHSYVHICIYMCICICICAYAYIYIKNKKYIYIALQGNEGELVIQGRFCQIMSICFRVVCNHHFCCSVLQCVAVCCSVLQCVAVCCSVSQCVAVCSSVLQCVAVCCSV